MQDKARTNEQRYVEKYHTPQRTAKSEQASKEEKPSECVEEK